MISASVVEPDRPMNTDSIDSGSNYNVSYQPQVPSELFRTQAFYRLGPGKWVDPGPVGLSKSTRTLVRAWLGPWGSGGGISTWNPRFPGLHGLVSGESAGPGLLTYEHPHLWL